MKVGKNLLVIGILVIGLGGFLVAGNWLTPSHENTISNATPSTDSPKTEITYFSNSVSTGYTDLAHHSIETKMSLHGKVIDINNNLVDDADLGVKISDTNSCTTNVFYDYTFPNLIQDGFFNVLLGQNEILRLNFNQDYFMCLYVNTELLSGPQVFRGGQGEIHSAELFDGDATTPLDVNYLQVQNDLNVEGAINMGCGKIFWNDVNQTLSIQVTC